MNNTSSNTDPQKKYWWVLLVVVPIILALIAIAPELFKKASPPRAQNASPPGIEQKFQGVKQTTDKGHNFTNVQGDITITETPPKEEKKP